MSDSSFTEAERRIRAAQDARELDLSDLALDQLPQSLERLRFLERLKAPQGAYDLRPVGTLENLCWLDARNSGFSDLAPLASLHKLRYLKLVSSFDVHDASPLAELTGLRVLDLRQTAVDDFSPLSGLTSLRMLSIGGHGDKRPDGSLAANATEVSFLSRLTQLEYLDIFQLVELSDISALANLTSLTSLQIMQSAALRDVSPLDGLRLLEDLSLKGSFNLMDIGPLRGLSAVTSLDFSDCRCLADISPISGFASLEKLDLSGCQLLEDLSALSGLNQLRSVNLNLCSRVGDIRPILHQVPSMKTLVLFGCPIDHLPGEILGEQSGQNVAPGVKAHLMALAEQGARQWLQCKVVVLGNGRVGKTSVIKALKGKPFDPVEDSTHGIQHWSDLWSMGLDAFGNPLEMNLQFWDFGGQDLFHNTHRLFMRSRAIFLIIWSAWEQWDVGEEEDPRRPLQYWLDQVYSLVPNAEVVLIRNKAELPANEAPHHPVDWKNQVGETHHELNAFDFSAARWESPGRYQDARRDLRVWIKNAALRMLGGEERRTIGSGRLKVIGDLQEKAFLRVMSPDGFANLVEKHMPNSSDAADPAVLLEFLHHAGVVYHDAQLMPERIIVDQTWALEGIYSLFDRRKCRDYLEIQEGRFTRSDLRRWLWEEQNYSQEEQTLFLGFMESCGIATQLLRAHETRSGEPLYLAPQYLPSRAALGKSLEQQITEFGEPSYEFPLLKDRFLGADAILSLVIRIARSFSRDALLWKYGAFFECRWSGTGPSAAFVEWTRDSSQTYGGNLIAKIYGEPGQLRKALEREFRHLEVAVSGSADSPNREVDEDYEIDLSDVAGPREDRVKPRITFSVAGLDRCRPRVYELMKALEKQTRKRFERDYRVLHYEACNEEVRVSELMESIAIGDLVIAGIGRKYLESPYCMREMHLIYERCDGSPKQSGESRLPADDRPLIIFRHVSGELLPKSRVFGNRSGQLSIGQWKRHWAKWCRKFEEKFPAVLAENPECMRRHPLYPWYQATNDGRTIEDTLTKIRVFWADWIYGSLPDDEQNSQAWAIRQLDELTEAGRFAAANLKESTKRGAGGKSKTR